MTNLPFPRDIVDTLEEIVNGTHDEDATTVAAAIRLQELIADGRITVEAGGRLYHTIEDTDDFRHCVRTFHACHTTADYIDHFTTFRRDFDRTHQRQIAASLQMLMHLLPYDASTATWTHRGKRYTLKTLPHLFPRRMREEQLQTVLTFVAHHMPVDEHTSVDLLVQVLDRFINQ